LTSVVALCLGSRFSFDRVHMRSRRVQEFALRTQPIFEIVAVPCATLEKQFVCARSNGLREGIPLGWLRIAAAS
jgi:hypothetical protein